MPRYMPKNSTVSHDLRSAMLSRPQMAIFVARVVSGWARVEERLGFIMIELLGAHARVGMKMYQALSGSAAQKAVLQACASELTIEMKEHLNELLREFKGVARRRNDIVHGHWSYSNDHPEDLVWCDSSSTISWQSEFVTAFAKADDRDDLRSLSSFKPSRERRYILYGAQEFDDLLADMQGLIRSLEHFRNAVETGGREPA